MPDTIAAAKTAPRRVRSGKASANRYAFATVLLAGSAMTAQAQTLPEHRSGFEFLVPSGILVPTGAQRAVVKQGNLTAAQVSYAFSPAFAITSTIGWARSRDIATSGAPKLDVFTYDVGAELRADRWLSGHAVIFSPFAGAGAGARSYNYRSLDVDATHNLAAYGSAGGELGYRRVRLRIEARDYLTGFKPLVAGHSTGQRNDISVLVGLRITRHSP